MRRPLALGLVLLLLTAVAGRRALQPPAAAGDQAKVNERLREVQRLTDLAVQLRKQRDLPAAIKVWRQRLALVRQIVGSEYTEAVAGSLELLAQLYEDNDDFAGAARAWRDAADSRAGFQGKEHWKVTDARLARGRAEKRQAMSPEQRLQLQECDRLRALAFRHYKMKDYAGATEVQRRALPLLGQVWGEESPEMATGLDTLGFFAQMGQDMPEARRHYARALEMRRRLLGEHPDTARSHRALGTVLNALGDRAGELREHERGLAIFRKTLGDEHRETQIAMESVASVAAVLGDVGSARAAHEGLVRLRRKLSGPTSPELARALVLYGNSELHVGNAAAGRPLLEEALGIYRAQPRPMPAETADCLASLATCYFVLKDAERERQSLEEAYALRRDALGDGHPDTMATRLALARLRRGGDPQSAYDEYGKVVAACRVAAGSEWTLIRALVELSEAALRLGRPDQARDHVEEALAVTRALPPAKLGPTSLSQLEVRLAFIAAAQKRWDEAITLLDRTRRAQKQFQSRGLSGLPEADQLTYLSLADRFQFQQAASLALANRDNPGLAAASAAWVINGKGATLEVLADRAVALRTASDPKVAEQVGQWQAARRALAALALRPVPADAAEARRKEVADLAGRERELARRIAEAGGRLPPRGEWVELEQVRQAMAADAVLVEIARVYTYTPWVPGNASWWHEPHYVAWVVPPAGGAAVRVVDLGPAEPIEQAVTAVRTAFAEAPKIVQRDGEPEAEKEVRKPLAALARLVLEPLRPHLAGAREWVLGPDAALWLVPWAALPDDGEHYVAERVVVRYVNSGRDLLPHAPFAGRVQPPVLLADPDYDFTATDTAAPGPEVRALPASVKLPKVRRLPSSAAEAKEVLPRLERYAGAKARLLTDAQAQEAALKRFANARALVLSTHGFFAEDAADLRPSALGEIGPGALQPDRPLENPLLRCGLMLAGCNRRDVARAGADDGVLTGLEIVDLDLRGCDLVVLSACETALGQVRIGEGVAGLRQAFQIAGARSVVASLWQVPDRATALLMADLFDGLADGQPPGRALQAAQRRCIVARRDAEAAAHPFFWAAFTVTGR